ncbi:enterobactin transporter EntS [Microbulbifer litoralis]|uniref:enterobactin transporter EntS n=1 Tax=Microbulbifer litoralis TaxID=2933965 RepID=UPI0020282FC9|nr:enterobactin transporter EntS [Microbulbifer sp. GX H0434]
MSIKSLFVDFSVLRHNRHFRNVFIARTISLLGLGMLSVAIPLQAYELSGDSFHVGLVMAIEGIGLFVGLLWGGVLADRHDRKKLILFARTTCGLGFVGLAVNAWLPQPSLAALYGLALWDGFFGALGVTALLAAMPFIVGRENLVQARAVSMVSLRLATVISPALGGVIIAASHVGWNYLIAALGTGLTLIPLLALPSMVPQQVEEQHPLRALAQGFGYLFGNRILLSVVAVGTLVTLTTAVRVLFPELVETVYGGGAFELGLMYSAVPVGATLGALVSGWASHLRRPGRVMLLCASATFACLALLGLNQNFILALLLLALFGYLVSITSLLEYSLVQAQTPDHYLGRINAIWTAQDACGDSVGSFGIGVLGKFLSSLASIFVIGAASLACGLLMLAGCRSLRNLGPAEAEGGEGEYAAG